MEPQDAIGDALERLKLLAPAGYAMALHVRFTTPTYLFQTYAKDWTEIYSQAGLVLRDPTVAWGFEQVGTIRWSELASRDDAGVLQLAAEHGLRFGITHALEREGSRTIASFARSDRDFTAGEIADIVALAEQLHDSTASGESLPAATRERLRMMSIHFTHP